MCVGVCARACTWNAVNNAFIVRASRPAQLGSRDFFSDDDDDAEGRVQRFGMSTFYVDSTLMNSRWCSRILKKREIKRVAHDAMSLYEMKYLRILDLRFKIY